MGDVKFGEHTVKLSGSGNYIETNTTTAPANPASGKIRLYATSGTSLRMRDSTGTETDLADTGTLYNFLTNPGFEIWQRGTGPFTASAAYTADRWSIALGTSSTITVTREGTTKRDDSRYSLKGVYTHSAQSVIRQSTEDDGVTTNEGLRGRTVTLAMWVNANAANAIGIGLYDGVTDTRSSRHTGGGGWELLTVTATIGATASEVRVSVILDATVTFYLDNATLVVGSTAQTYYPLHPADEWERCQRYYEVQGGNAGGLPVWAGAAGDSVTYHGVSHPFATRKAVAATMTKAGTWATTNCAQPAVDTTLIDGYRVVATPSSSPGYTRFMTDSTDDTITAEANP